MEIEPKSALPGESVTLDLTLTDAQGASEPQFKSSPDFTITKIGSSTQLSIINGAQSSSVTYRYQVDIRKGLQPGKYKLPEAVFDSSGVAATAESPTITIEASRSPRVTKADDAGLAYIQVVNNDAPYIGEQVMYKAEVASVYPLAAAEIAEEEFQGFLKESFGKLRETVRTIGSGQTKVFSVREAIFPNQSGTVQIPPRTLNIKVQMPNAGGGWSVFDDLFSGGFDPFSIVTKRLVSDPITLTVKPLPQAPEGVEGYIPVGNITAAAVSDRMTLIEGESVSLIITVEGDGNLRPLEVHLPKAIEDSFEIYPDAPTIDTKVDGNRLMFSKRFAFGLVPKKTGTVTIASVKIPTFDPRRGEYQILATEPKTLTVVADPNKKRLVTTAPNPVLSTPSVVATPASGVSPAVELDLAPQKIPARIEYSDLPYANSKLLVVLLLSLAASIWFYLKRKRAEFLTENPQVKRRLEARARADQALSASVLSLSDLSFTLKRYLSDRFAVALEGQTALEVQKGIEPLELQPAKREEVVAILSEIEKLSYAPRSEGSIESMKKRVQDLIHSIAEAQ